MAPAALAVQGNPNEPEAGRKSFCSGILSQFAGTKRVQDAKLNPFASVEEVGEAKNSIWEQMGQNKKTLKILEELYAFQVGPGRKSLAFRPREQRKSRKMSENETRANFWSFVTNFSAS